MATTDGEHADKHASTVSFHPFEPERIYDELIGKRKVVYLDQNIWILLRDGGTATACREACLAAVRAGRAIFPVSYAAVSELMAIPSSSSRKAQAELADALSLGVTLRNPDVVFGLEGLVLYRHLFHGSTDLVRRNAVFTSLPDFVGDGTLTIEIPVGAPPTDASELRRLWHEQNPARSLRWIVDNLDDLARTARHAAAMAKYRSQMEALQETRRATPAEQRPDRKAAISRERNELFNTYVIPVVSSALVRETNAVPAGTATPYVAVPAGTRTR